MANKLTPPELVAARFGGYRKLSRLMGRSESIVSQWRRRGRIPGSAQIGLIELAKRHRVKLTLHELVYGGAA